jgi:hypothetical protein
MRMRPEQMHDRLAQPPPPPAVIVTVPASMPVTLVMPMTVT